MKNIYRFTLIFTALCALSAPFAKAQPYRSAEKLDPIVWHRSDRLGFQDDEYALLRHYEIVLPYFTPAEGTLEERLRAVHNFVQTRFAYDPQKDLERGVPHPLYFGCTISPYEEAHLYYHVLEKAGFSPSFFVTDHDFFAMAKVDGVSKIFFRGFSVPVATYLELLQEGNPIFVHKYSEGERIRYTLDRDYVVDLYPNL